MPGVAMGLEMTLEEMGESAKRTKLGRAIAEGRAFQLTGGAECTALVLVDTHAVMKAKKERAKEWLQETVGIKLASRGGGGGGHHHDDAHGAGFADGRRSGFSRSSQKRITG